MTTSILVVEDDPDLRDAMTTILEGEGYDVLTAGNANDALQRLRSERGACVVLLDWTLDGETGDAVLEGVKSDPDLAQVQVVVITGASHTRHPEGIRVVRKPVDLDELLRTVRSACDGPRLRVR